MLSKYTCLYVYTGYRDLQRDCPSLPVSWSGSRSSLCEKGGVLGLRFLPLCSPRPRPLPHTASLQWSPAFCEDSGERWSWWRDFFSQFRVWRLWLASQSSCLVLRNTSPLTLGRGGLRCLSWPGWLLSRCSGFIWGLSLALPELEDDRDLSDEQGSSGSSKFSWGCLDSSFRCFAVFPSLWSLQGLEAPEPNSLALLDRGWSEWRWRNVKNRNAG